MEVEWTPSVPVDHRARISQARIVQGLGLGQEEARALRCRRTAERNFVEWAAVLVARLKGERCWVEGLVRG